MKQRPSLQQPEPEDFVIATGEQHSVREFCEQAFGHVGVRLAWEGSGVNETGFVAGLPSSSEDLPGLSRLKEGDELVFVDPRYFRPTEVETLLGDPTKAKTKLGWTPRIRFSELVQEMVKEDLHQAKRDLFCQREGFYEACERSSKVCFRPRRFSYRGGQCLNGGVTCSSASDAT